MGHTQNGKRGLKETIKVLIIKMRRRKEGKDKRPAGRREDSGEAALVVKGSYSGIHSR